VKARHFSGLAVFFLVALPLTVQAETQTVVVDGQYDDWDLDKEFSLPMRSHLQSSCPEGLSPNVYLRYDENSNTVFVLVLQQEAVRDGMSKPVVNIYSLGQKYPAAADKKEKISDFSWVMKEGSPIGWEAAFQLLNATYDCGATGSGSGAAEASEENSERKNALEVEVIDTERFFSKYK